MRVVFLDIDGVLVPGPFLRGVVASAGHRMRSADDPYKVSLLNELQDVPGVRIVFSSSWRSHSDMPAAVMSQGIEIPLHEDGRTTFETSPRFGIGVHGWQIYEWVERHPEVEGYVIVDDDTDMLPHQAVHFLQTSYEEGLMPRHIELMRSILMSPIDREQS